MRYAIRVDADTLLAVPPMNPKTPHITRVRILEYVLRRQIGTWRAAARRTTPTTPSSTVSPSAAWGWRHEVSRARGLYRMSPYFCRFSASAVIEASAAA